MSRYRMLWKRPPTVKSLLRGARRRWRPLTAAAAFLAVALAVISVQSTGLRWNDVVEWGHLQLFAFFRGIGWPQQAAPHLEAAIHLRKDQSEPDWYCTLASVYGELKRPRQAAGAYAACAIGFFRSGVASQEIVSVVERSVQLEETEEAFELLGRLNFARDDLDRARDSVDVLLERYPDNHYGHFALGVLAWQEGKYEEAKKALRVVKDVPLYGPAFDDLVEYEGNERQLAVLRPEIERLDVEHQQHERERGRAMVEAIIPVGLIDLLPFFRVPKMIRRIAKVVALAAAIAAVFDALSTAREHERRLARLNATRKEEYELLARRADLTVMPYKYFSDLGRSPDSGTR